MLLLLLMWRMTTCSVNWWRCTVRQRQWHHFHITIVVVIVLLLLILILVIVVIVMLIVIVMHIDIDIFGKLSIAIAAAIAFLASHSSRPFLFVWLRQRLGQRRTWWCRCYLQRIGSRQTRFLIGREYELAVVGVSDCSRRLLTLLLRWWLLHRTVLAFLCFLCSGACTRASQVCLSRMRTCTRIVDYWTVFQSSNSRTPATRREC
mmetsp:Transcript_55367/g.91962  ORF Transcript_55367/g.91962 Transcript_55367/m.91962 type:complete len:205 (+) Transcript_55367:957-1571(+)